MVKAADDFLRFILVVKKIFLFGNFCPGLSSPHRGVNQPFFQPRPFPPGVVEKGPGCPSALYPFDQAVVRLQGFTPERRKKGLPGMLK